MTKQGDEKTKASELSADDLDMAVGGAGKLEAAAVSKGEENIKLADTKAEQHRKHGAVPREEKQKQQ